jgi:hypothetical protein
VGKIGPTLKHDTHCAPRLTNKETMQTLLPLPDGTLKRIDEMSAEEFLDAAEMLLSQCSDELQRLTRLWLYTLDYSLVDHRNQYDERWYALDCLLRLEGVTLPELPKKCEVAA